MQKFTSISSNFSLAHRLIGRLFDYLNFRISGRMALLILLRIRWFLILRRRSLPKWYILFQWNRYISISCCFSGKLPIFYLSQLWIPSAIWSHRSGSALVQNGIWLRILTLAQRLLLTLLHICVTQYFASMRAKSDGHYCEFRPMKFRSRKTNLNSFHQKLFYLIMNLL